MNLSPADYVSRAAPNLLHSLHVFDVAYVGTAATAATTPGDTLSSNNEENVRHGITFYGEPAVHIELAEGC